ncbi:hypothetical protein [Paenibacillus kandeliae]|uniref:hypothetical protein n=1 Tax=Paenibacillus kandeliae TaxID=3231269 RepID=UPI00345956D3
MQPWNSTPTKAKQSILTIADGVNRSFESIEIKESECVSASNLDSSLYPTVTTISGVRMFSQLNGVISKIFKYQDELYVTNGSGLYRQAGEFFSNVYAQPNNDQTIWDASLFFDGSKMYFTDGVSQLKKYSGNQLTTVADSPDYGAFVTTHANRFFIAKRISNELRFSALREPENWSSTEKYTGSGTIVVETPDGEKPTALTTFGDQVILFKKYTMHKLYGEDPTNFTMAQPYGVGCISDKSVVVTRDALYFLGIDGFYVYQGGLSPIKISDPIKNYISIMNPTQQNCAGYDGRFIYLSLCTSGSLSPNITLKYDTQGGRWWALSYVATAFYLDGIRLYGGTNDGRIVVMNESLNILNAPITWSIELKPFSDEDETIRKVINKLWVVSDLDPGSSLKIEYAPGTEGGTWTSVYSNTNGSGVIDTQTIPVIVRVPDRWFRIRMSGTGKVKIHRLIRETARRGN